MKKKEVNQQRAPGSDRVNEEQPSEEAGWTEVEGTAVLREDKRENRTV